MNWTLVVSALEKHVRMSQQAMLFAQQHRKGVLFQDALGVYTEAANALRQVKAEIVLRRVQRIKSYDSNPQNFKNRNLTTEVCDATDHDVRGVPLQPQGREEDDAARLGVTVDDVSVPDTSGSSAGSE